MSGPREVNESSIDVHSLQLHSKVIADIDAWNHSVREHAFHRRGKDTDERALC
jgi:hypothetical protein